MHFLIDDDISLIYYAFRFQLLSITLLLLYLLYLLFNFFYFIYTFIFHLKFHLSKGGAKLMYYTVDFYVNTVDFYVNTVDFYVNTVEFVVAGDKFL